MTGTARLSAAGPIPTRDDLLARAREMVPTLRERAGEAERNRRVPDETQQAFVDAGFYRIFVPKRWGGYEMDYTTSVDIAAELGRGCGSSAWIFTNLAQQSLVNGIKDPRAQEELWADGPDAVVSSAFAAPDATIRRVEGGFVVDGVWHYSSGIDFASGVNLQLFLRPEDGPPEHRFAFVAKSDYEVIDDWFVTGLAATGSRSLRLKEVFIPDYRTMSSRDVTGGPTPGHPVSDNPLYQMPFWGTASRLFSSPLIGIARGALELMEEDIAGRTSAAGIRLAEQPIVHLRLAEAGGEIEAAWALALRDCVTSRRMTEEGRIPSLAERAAWRRNSSYAALLCVRAVDRLHDLAGMRAMDAGSHIQRAWRDVHAGASQIGIVWDLQAGIYGRARFGLPMGDPRA
jgi:3-hydroxy-9,10-secoandrosta-1,3,5(10)-triene-9,17-dione monooxygenase